MMATTAPTSAIVARRNTLATVLRRGTVFLFLAALIVFFSLTAPRFLQVENLVNIAVQNAHVIVVAVGMTIVMLAGGIDLSVGSVAALVGAVSAYLIVQNGWSVGTAILAGLGLGFLVGLLNGLMVVYGKLPPFAATLAMLGVARGLTLVLTEGRPISIRDTPYTFWSEGTVGPIPVPVIVWLVVAGLVWWLLSQTRFGLHIYAVGGHEETARLAGVPVNRVKLLAFALSGLLAALAGVLLTARVATAQPRTGVGLELQAIAAAVLGGVSLFGGVGTIPGTVLGALMVGTLGNGMKMLRIASYPQQVIQGVVLVFAVAVDMFVKRLERR